MYGGETHPTRRWMIFKRGELSRAFNYQPWSHHTWMGRECQGIEQFAYCLISWIPIHKIARCRHTQMSCRHEWGDEILCTVQRLAWLPRLLAARYISLSPLQVISGAVSQPALINRAWNLRINKNSERAPPSDTQQLKMNTKKMEGRRASKEKMLSRFHSSSSIVFFLFPLKYTCKRHLRLSECPCISPTVVLF